VRNIGCRRLSDRCLVASYSKGPTPAEASNQETSRVDNKQNPCHVHAPKVRRSRACSVSLHCRHTRRCSQSQELTIFNVRSCQSKSRQVRAHNNDILLRSTPDLPVDVRENLASLHLRPLDEFGPSVQASQNRHNSTHLTTTAMSHRRCELEVQATARIGIKPQEWPARCHKDVETLSERSSARTTRLNLLSSW
jgi:hypothetical protein